MTPATPHMALGCPRLAQRRGNGLDEQRRLVQVPRRHALAIDVSEPAFHLFHIPAQTRRRRGRRLTLGSSMEQKIQIASWQREVELLLRLREGEGVGRRRSRDDLSRNAEVLGQTVDLRLVEMR